MKLDIQEQIWNSATVMRPNVEIIKIQVGIRPPY